MIFNWVMNAVLEIENLPKEVLEIPKENEPAIARA